MDEYLANFNNNDLTKVVSGFDLKICTQVPVYGTDSGSDQEGQPSEHPSLPILNTVSDGEMLEFGNLKFSVQFTPGHTVGHVVYLLDGSPFGTQDSLFSGDHLFLSGCGRMFEGPAATMLKSLDHVSKIDKNTLIWPGSTITHKYNINIQNKFLWVKDQRNKRLCTCPSTMEEELSYNPFLRTSQESVLKSLGMVNTETFQTPDDRSRSQALAEIRHQKDNYKYK
ncbi:hypothetical protein KUTeg_008281, partial [Tegillarca granosa]